MTEGSGSRPSDDFEVHGWARFRRLWTRANRRADRFMGRWGYAALSALALAVCVVGAPTFVAAARDQGDPGTFTGHEKDCVRWNCTWTGSFVSDDGAVHLDDVMYDGGGLHDAGDSVRVQWLRRDRSSVFAPHDRSWLTGLGGVVVSTGYLAWWFTRRRWRR